VTNQPVTNQPWPAQRRAAWIVAAVLLALFGAGGLALGVAAAATEGVGLSACWWWAARCC